MPLTFAKAVPAQHDAIYDLMSRAFMAYVQKIDPAATSGPYPWLADAIADGDVYVALDGDAVAGMITTKRTGAGELMIDQVGVDPERQGQGVGSWLLEQLEQAARDEGVTTLVLQTAQIMDHLLRLYTRHGFVETHWALPGKVIKRWLERALPDHGDDEYLRVHMRKHIW